MRLLSGDMDSKEGKMDCAGLITELDALHRKEKNMEAIIHSNRGQNQAAGYIGGVLFLPALLAIEGNEEERKVLDQLVVQKDRILRLTQYRNCQSF